MSIEDFERNIYPVIWHQAYDAGMKTREDGLPRKCNLQGRPFCHNDNVLKVYKSAWEQGWDGYQIPPIFKKMEEALSKMPLRKMEQRDL